MKPRRVFVVSLGALAAILLAATLLQPWFPGCLFHRMTGLHCPGCGMTRAADAVLHGRIADGFRFHPLGLIVFGLAFLWMIIRIPAWLRGISGTGFPKINGQAGAWIAGGILVFWILRNIPFWPFILLSPP